MLRSATQIPKFSKLVYMVDQECIDGLDAANEPFSVLENLRDHYSDNLLIETLLIVTQYYIFCKYCNTKYHIL